MAQVDSANASIHRHRDALGADAIKLYFVFRIAREK
jgi:hypothetical protein